MELNWYFLLGRFSHSPISLISEHVKAMIWIRWTGKPCNSGSMHSCGFIFKWTNLLSAPLRFERSLTFSKASLASIRPWEVRTGRDMTREGYGLKAAAVHTMKTLPTGAMKGHPRKDQESHRRLPPSEKESPNIFFSFTGKHPTKVFEALDLQIYRQDLNFKLLMLTINLQGSLSLLCF